VQRSIDEPRIFAEAGKVFDRIKLSLTMTARFPSCDPIWSAFILSIQYSTTASGSHLESEFLACQGSDPPQPSVYAKHVTRLNGNPIGPPSPPSGPFKSRRTVRASPKWRRQIDHTPGPGRRVAAIFSIPRRMGIRRIFSAVNFAPLIPHSIGAFWFRRHPHIAL